MPSRKQRRRREKSFRHEYEYVYVDADGRDVDVEPEEAAEAPAPKPKREPKRASPARAPARSDTRRAARGVQPPSWNRTLRRAVPLAPLMFILVYLLNRDYTLVQNVVTTLTLLLVFVPFSYLVDSVMWRTFRRRTGADAAKPR